MATISQTSKPSIENLYKLIREKDSPQAMESIIATAGPGWSSFNGPLRCAAECDRTKIAKSLLKHKASPNVKDAQGRAAIHYARSAEMVLMTILKDPNERDYHEDTPLHQAAAKGHLSAVKTLLHYRADPNLKSKDLSTALHRAKEPNVLKLLIREDAEINVPNDRGETPIHILAQSSDAKAMHAVLSAYLEMEAGKEDNVNEGLEMLWDWSANLASIARKLLALS